MRYISITKNAKMKILLSDYNEDIKLNSAILSGIEGRKLDSMEPWELRQVIELCKRELLIDDNTDGWITDLASERLESIKRCRDTYKKAWGL